MKILSINYPKQIEDEKKIEKLVSNYESKIRSKVDLEVQKYHIADNNLL